MYICIFCCCCHFRHLENLAPFNQLIEYFYCLLQFPLTTNCEMDVSFQLQSI